jgi:hypothetical protein
MDQQANLMTIPCVVDMALPEMTVTFGGRRRGAGRSSVSR